LTGKKTSPSDSKESIRKGPAEKVRIVQGKQGPQEEEGTGKRASRRRGATSTSTGNYKAAKIGGFFHEATRGFVKEIKRRIKKEK